MIGFAAALAEVIRVNDDPVQINDVMTGTGITLADFKKAGVESYDLGTIRKCLRDIGPMVRS